LVQRSRAVIEDFLDTKESGKMRVHFRGGLRRVA
jgi:hypothetical protein